MLLRYIVGYLITTFNELFFGLGGGDPRAPPLMDKSLEQQYNANELFPFRSISWFHLVGLRYDERLTTQFANQVKNINDNVIPEASDFFLHFKQLMFKI